MSDTPTSLSLFHETEVELNQIRSETADYYRSQYEKSSQTIFRSLKHGLRFRKLLSPWILTTSVAFALGCFLFFLWLLFAGSSLARPMFSLTMSLNLGLFMAFIELGPGYRFLRKNVEPSDVAVKIDKHNHLQYRVHVSAEGDRLGATIQARNGYHHIVARTRVFPLSQDENKRSQELKVLANWVAHLQQEDDAVRKTIKHNTSAALYTQITTLLHTPKISTVANEEKTSDAKKLDQGIASALSDYAADALRMQHLDQQLSADTESFMKETSQIHERSSK
jgi:ABC-type multidrug transport system fused ATPase/permease subunit